MRFQAQTPAEARAWQEAARAKLFALMMGGGQPERVPAGRKSPSHHRSARQPLRAGRTHLADPAGPPRARLAGPAHAAEGQSRRRARPARPRRQRRANRARHQPLLVWARADRAGLCGHLARHRPARVAAHQLDAHGRAHLGRAALPGLRRHAAGSGPSRLAVAGLSLGGETTMYVAALDERLQARVQQRLADHRRQHEERPLPVLQFPRAWRRTSISPTSSPASRRGRWCANWASRRRRPAVFPCRSAGRPSSEIRAAYRVFNAESNLTLTVHPGPHVFNGEDFWPLACAPHAGRPSRLRLWHSAGQRGLPRNAQALGHATPAPREPGQRRAAPPLFPPGRERTPAWPTRLSSAAAATLTAGSPIATPPPA